MSAMSTLFFNVVNDYGLEQCVQEPTRQSHMLDLVFAASQPFLIESILTIPGISDHETVILLPLASYMFYTTKYKETTKSICLLQSKFTEFKT